MVSLLGQLGGSPPDAGQQEGIDWRVTMIAAPDVAARTIGPGDYLRWPTGRADELFVTSRADLAARLAALDMAPDPDGRYRVNAFCCRHNTWQATVVELMRRADVVLMDVRSLSRDRLGCEFELQQLAQRLPPHRSARHNEQSCVGPSPLCREI